jgi:hypothetical protein
VIPVQANAGNSLSFASVPPTIRDRRPPRCDDDDVDGSSKVVNSVMINNKEGILIVLNVDVVGRDNLVIIECIVGYDSTELLVVVLKEMMRM